LENFFRAHSRSFKLSERVENTRPNSLAVEVVMSGGKSERDHPGFAGMMNRTVSAR
jgi:hypothetical protein